MISVAKVRTKNTTSGRKRATALKRFPWISSRRSRARSVARKDRKRIEPDYFPWKSETSPGITSLDSRSRIFHRRHARTLADTVLTAREGYFRSNGVKSQALLSHFAVQCFNISLCLCRSWPPGRGRAARPGA